MHAKNAPFDRGFSKPMQKNREALHPHIQCVGFKINGVRISHIDRKVLATKKKYRSRCNNQLD